MRALTRAACDFAFGFRYGVAYMARCGALVLLSVAAFWSPKDDE